jgi:hypothetical protein
VFFRSSQADVWIDSSLKEMEDLSSAEEDSEGSVFLLADSCSTGSRGQSDKEASDKEEEEKMS